MLQFPLYLFQVCLYVELIQLIFLYRESKKRAQLLAEELESENSNIGGMSINVNVMSISELLATDQKFSLAGIFISERLNDSDLKEIIKFTEKRKRIAFSPFTGDVERGVAVGISVTNRVKPYFNLHALKRSEIVINALLMKMSRRYE